MSDKELDIVLVKADFVGAALYKTGDSLISYSALIDGKDLLVKIVVMDSISPDEEDRLHDILGAIVGNYNHAHGDSTLVKVESVAAALDVELLPIAHFHRAI